MTPRLAAGSGVRAVFVICAVLATARAATAQPSGAREEGRAELAISGLLSAPSTLGHSSALYKRPDGAPFALFTSENRSTAGVGAEVHAGVRLSRRVAVEGTASWSRTRLTAEITSDFEGATGEAPSERLTRFTGEGSLLVVLASRGSLSWFARGGAGLMRELAGDGVYGTTGTIGNAGAGVKYWRRAGSGSRRGLGLRVEGRATIRARGVALGAPKTIVAPVISGGIMFGF